MSHYLILGKDDCPHTQKARADYKKKCIPFLYVNVEKDPRAMEKLLDYTDGKYMIPVIVNVDKGDVEIGYTGEE